MRKRFFFTIMIVIFACLLVVSLLFFALGRDIIIDSELEDLENYSHIIQRETSSLSIDEYQDYTNEFISNTTNDYRITFVDKLGKVIAETHYRASIEKMDNHIDRIEIQQAQQNGFGFNIRSSSTLGISYLYYALKTDWGFIRISSPLSSIKYIERQLLKYILFAALAGIFVALVLSRVLSKQLLKPISDFSGVSEKIANGTYITDIDMPKYSEFNSLKHSFEKMAEELSRAFESINEKNDHLTSLIQNIDEAIVLFDTNLNVKFANNNYLKLIGSDKDNIIGIDVLKIVPANIIYDMLEKINRDGSRIDKEISFNSKIYHTIICPVKGYNNNSKDIILSINDVSELKKLEHIRSDFVSNVTHELRTPLTSIRGFVETIRINEDMPLETRNRFLDIISIENDRLSSLIDDILTLSEIETPTSLIEKESISINDVINDVIKLMNATAKKRNITLTYYHEDDIFIYAQYNHIKQMILNLVDNAIKYNKDNGSVSITTSKLGSITQISIKDSGSGISDKHKNRIFERFYRIDKGRSKQMGGTGLGLSIVKHIVNMYNASINIYDGDDGIGSNFIIKFS